MLSWQNTFCTVCLFRTDALTCNEFADCSRCCAQVCVQKAPPGQRGWLWRRRFRAPCSTWFCTPLTSAGAQGRDRCCPHLGRPIYPSLEGWKDFFPHLNFTLSNTAVSHTIYVKLNKKTSRVWKILATFMRCFVALLKLFFNMLALFSLIKIQNVCR